MVIAPASTGNANSSIDVVISIAHTKSGMCSSFIPFHRILMMVVMKFIALRIEDMPARCSEKIVRSTAKPK